MDSSCTTIVNPRLFAPDIVPVAPACHCLTESASAAEAYMVADLLDENSRRRRILRTLHRPYLASSLQRIRFRSFPGVSMFSPASLSASFLIRPYLAREALPLPGASRRPPMPPSPNRAAHSWTVRRSTSAKYAASFVGYPASIPRTAIILLRILASCSARMASASSRIFLSVSSTGGLSIW